MVLTLRGATATTSLLAVLSASCCSTWAIRSSDFGAGAAGCALSGATAWVSRASTAVCATPGNAVSGLPAASLPAEASVSLGERSTTRLGGGSFDAKSTGCSVVFTSFCCTGSAGLAEAPPLATAS